MRDIIKTEFMDVMQQTDAKLLIELSDDAVLLNTGMDSLGFAILVAQLETKLGYDPFSLMDVPYYPVTFGDFVQIYERFKDNRTA